MGRGEGLDSGYCEAGSETSGWSLVRGSGYYIGIDTNFHLRVAELAIKRHISAITIY